MHHPLSLVYTLLQCFNCENGWWDPLLVLLYIMYTYICSLHHPTWNSMDEIISVWRTSLVCIYTWHVVQLRGYTLQELCFLRTQRCLAAGQCKILPGFSLNSHRKRKKKKNQTFISLTRMHCKYKHCGWDEAVSGPVQKCQALTVVCQSVFLREVKRVWTCVYARSPERWKWRAPDLKPGHAPRYRG